MRLDIQMRRVVLIAKGARAVSLDSLPKGLDTLRADKTFPTVARLGAREPPRVNIHDHCRNTVTIFHLSGGVERYSSLAAIRALKGRILSFQALNLRPKVL